MQGLPEAIFLSIYTHSPFQPSQTQSWLKKIRRRAAWRRQPLISDQEPWDSG